jgi:O-antigen/teichoic acid export membrane protein
MQESNFLRPSSCACYLQIKMTENKTLLSDGLWVALMQLAAAAGQLLGIRILTTLLPPDVFGESILWTGIVFLISTAIANPTMQALLRFYPEYELQGKAGFVTDVIRRQLKKIFIAILPILLGGMIAVVVSDISELPTVLLVMCLMFVEVSRTRNLALLNATHAHRPYGTWIFIEAWARPLCAWLLIFIAGVDVAYVIAGYLLATLLSLGIMRRSIPRVEAVKGIVDSELSKRVWKYSLPLLPLGVLGWISGMSDRYIIGALLNTSDVGLYVAIYSLASRPMLMLGSILETTLRPLYQTFLIKGDALQAGRHLSLWLKLILAGCLVAIVLAWFGHAWIAGWLLGEEYRDVSSMMPWIVAGYSLRLLSNIAVRICYANEDTKNILVIEAASSLLAIIVSYVCIIDRGIWGAAIAVPISYGIRMVISLWLVRPWLVSTNSANE